MEYPDGAPPEVIREMKESETFDVEFKKGSVKRNQTEVPTVSNRPMTMRRQGPIRAPTPVGSPDSNVEGFGRTDVLLVSLGWLHQAFVILSSAKGGLKS